ncbi:response regulator [Vogesella oryzae]|uniref:response regulator n=1 Tax=Vogesella oryzae TaxID=1735285 RepID=UPI001583533C|nr:response regulator [Vogesella oryzae]
MSNKILLVEDSTAVLRTMQRILENDGFEVECAVSMQEVKHILQQGNDFLACVLDYCLPDAPDGEALSLVLNQQIPTIVLTARSDMETREKVLLQPVVDYVPKDSPAAFDYTIKMVRRIKANPGIRVLVVDDSATARGYLRQLLRRHRYEVLEAGDADTALRMLRDDPSIRLVLSDHDMPGKSGVVMVNEIRRFRSQEELAIIGISGSQDPTMTARFIKSGADDYLNKPFNHEEFTCRVTRNIEFVENLCALSRAANEDPLTALPNRRYFFENAMKQTQPFGVAMIDIDHFKSINDRYGHDTGDLALKLLADLLRAHFPGQLIARFGGEEFVILLEAEHEQSMLPALETFREQVAQMIYPTTQGDLQFTLSIGVAAGQHDISALLKLADDRLYRAKGLGRNRVCSS